MSLPFKEHYKDSLMIREFSEEVNSEELVWHRDRENRNIKVRSGNGWQLQIENALPVNLCSGENYYIPRNTYHRVIKGYDNLIIEIRESK